MKTTTRQRLGRRAGFPARSNLPTVPREACGFERVLASRGRASRAWACIALLLVSPDSLRTQTPGPTNAPAASPEPPRELQLRGKVVCLAEEMHERHQAQLPTRHEHVFGFKSEEGKYYTLLRTKFSEALFADERVRAKDLLLKARLFPNTHVLEVQWIRSLRNGVVQDLYYYCIICEIFAVAPGPCECCQEPTELVEKPL